MKSQTIALIGILERMEPLYLRVYDILQKEREALIQLDYEKIYESLVEKDEVISVLRTLDTERLKLQDEISALLNLKSSDLNLKQISDLIKDQMPELSSRLLVLRTQVNQRISNVVDRVTVNRSLIEKSVKNLQEIAKNLTRAIAGTSDEAGGKSEHGTYDVKAKYSGPKQSSGSLVRKQL